MMSTRCLFVLVEFRCVVEAMIQTGLIQNAHDDLVTDVSYDFYGLRFATCSIDQKYVCCVRVSFSQ